MRREELIDYLEKLYQVKLFRDWAHNGLQVEGKQEIQRVAYAVSASLEVIEKAVLWKADALVVHHGLFWDKSRFLAVGAMAKRLKQLFKHEISLLAYHLPMDAHGEFGNNWPVARALGLEELSAFGDSLGQKIGVLGSVRSMPAQTMVQAIAAYYGTNPRVAGPLSGVINRVAIISGGAHKSFQEALEAGADLFITGTADEPIWHEAKESSKLFVSVGHSRSERVGPRALSEHLSKQFSLESLWIEDDNPF